MGLQCPFASGTKVPFGSKFTLELLFFLTWA